MSADTVGPVVQHQRATGLDRELLVKGYAALTFAMIALQKFALPIPGGQVGLDTLLLVGGLVFLFAQGAVTIDLTRAALYALFIMVATIGLFFVVQPWSLPAFAIVVLLYFSMCFHAVVDRATLLRCLRSYRTGMMIVAWIVIAQQVTQYTIGNRVWPNLDAIVPGSLLYEGFAYLRPYEWNSPYLKPNGIVFLEPSALSLALAAALLVEWRFFHSWHMLLLFGTALIVGLGGTGPLALVFVAPLILFKLPFKYVALVIGAGVLLLIPAIASGLLAPFLERAGEFSNPQSSGYFRVTMPLQQLALLVDQPSLTFTGFGAGMSPKGDDIVQWPIQKLFYEYGFLAAALFHVFLLTAMLRAPASRTLSVLILIPYLFFGGGFVSHATVMMLVLLGSLLSTAPQDATIRRYAVRPLRRSPTTTAGDPE